MQRSFVRHFCGGMTQTAAARAAGYSFPRVEGCKLMKMKPVQNAIRLEQKKYEEKSSLTREKVLEGLEDAIEIARLQADPMGMIAGYREISRICGFNAPEQKQVQIAVGTLQQMHQLESLSDNELAKLILDGQYESVDDDEDDDEAVALLEDLDGGSDEGD